MENAAELYRALNEKTRDTSTATIVVLAPMLTTTNERFGVVHINFPYIKIPYIKIFVLFVVLLLL